MAQEVDEAIESLIGEMEGFPEQRQADDADLLPGPASLPTSPAAPAGRALQHVAQVRCHSDYRCAPSQARPLYSLDRWSRQALEAEMLRTFFQKSNCIIFNSSIAYYHLSRAAAGIAGQTAAPAPAPSSVVVGLRCNGVHACACMCVCDPQTHARLCLCVCSRASISLFGS